MHLPSPDPHLVSTSLVDRLVDGRMLKRPLELHFGCRDTPCKKRPELDRRSGLASSDGSPIQVDGLSQRLFLRRRQRDVGCRACFQLLRLPCIATPDLRHRHQRSRSSTSALHLDLHVEDLRLYRHGVQHQISARASTRQLRGAGQLLAGPARLPGSPAA